VITRRIFLRNGALTLVGMGLVPSFLARTARASDGRRRKILVAVFQRGAADGLNVVAPFGESRYYQARPTIAIPRPASDNESLLDLDGFFGLHPRLAPLKPLYDARRLAVVHAVGSPDATRSHFDAQDYMETATPGMKSTTDGWLNRYLQAVPGAGESSFRAVALSPQLPRSLQGHAAALALGQVGQFGIHPGRLGPDLAVGLEREYASASDPLLGGAGREAFEAMKVLQAANPARYQPAPGAEYPRSPFGQALKQVAQLVKADVGLEIAFAELGGWDTHVNQGAAAGQLGARLDDLARGIGAFARDLDSRFDDVMLLTMSEFGRAVAENGNRGTDHGHGNVMFVAGGSVRGGKIYGTWPGLEPEQRFEGRDLAVTTDFRDVFGELVVRHLGVADPAPIFPGYRLEGRRFLGLLS
jgi:uncharacterized protein (DUF1501 family)